MRTIAILCLVALLIFLAWKFEVREFVQEILDSIADVAGAPRGYYP